MQANELRIGNWVLHRGKYVQVNANTILAIVNGSEHYAPIPLTPEILEECGFECASDEFGGYLINISEKEKIRIIKQEGNFIFPLFGVTKVPTNFLHQLQNLYFSLTNTELQWNRKQ